MAITLDGTTGIASVDGSASSPSVRGADSNSGIVYAADEVKISTGGTERAKVNSSGHFLPGAADTYDLGANTTPWRNIWMENDLYIEDNGMAVFGTGEDLKIYHDGSNNEIKNITGDLFIRSNSAGDKAIAVRNNAGVDLYYDNSKKFETASGGTVTTGTIQGNYGSGEYGAQFNDSQTSGTHIQFQRQGYNNGNITHDTNNSAYNTSGSDRTLKKNFEDWTDSYWTAFKNLSPQKFHFLTDENSDPKCRGYIAQDLVATFPEAYPKEVVSDKYMFNPSGMVPYLMKTLKEALIEIDTLKTKVAALEAA